MKLALGGLEYVLSADARILPPEEDSYREFVSPPSVLSAAEVLDVQVVVTPEPNASGDVLFETDAHWSVLADGAARVFRYRRLPAGPAYSVRFQPGSSDVLVDCVPAMLLPGPPPALPCPIRYPVDQVLSMYLMGSRGVLVHAAGMLVHGRAIVLAGVSGAGKTTFAALARDRSGWEPLSDERVIVRVPDEAGVAVAHGTPWSGEGRVAHNARGRLAWLLFLSQGDENRIQPIPPPEAAARLLPTASIPWYDGAYLGASLLGCERLVERVPAALLTFRRDAGAVDAVERFLEEDVRPRG